MRRSYVLALNILPENQENTRSKEDVPTWYKQFYYDFFS